MAFGLGRARGKAVVEGRVSPAQSLFQRLAQQIAEFEDGLDADEEVVLRLVQAPDFSVMHVEDLGFWAPDLLIFHGLNEQGRPMQLLQHYAQVNMLLSSVPRLDGPARRIGFHLVEKAEG